MAARNYDAYSPDQFMVFSSRRRVQSHPARSESKVHRGTPPLPLACQPELDRRQTICIRDSMDTPQKIDLITENPVVPAEEQPRENARSAETRRDEPPRGRQWMTFKIGGNKKSRPRVIGGGIVKLANGAYGQTTR